MCNLSHASDMQKYVLQQKLSETFWAVHGASVRTLSTTTSTTHEEVFPTFPTTLSVLLKAMLMAKDVPFAASFKSTAVFIIF